MTIPSRPAPAPPGSRAQNAAAGANASIEQLRLQLQQQQQQQQQQQNFTIKLPPPPKPRNVGGQNGFQHQISKRPQTTTTTTNNGKNNNFMSIDSTSTSITRKFPQARYTPATNWDDSPFAPTNNGNCFNKKVAPPRPPPPKMQINGRKMTAPTPPPSNSSGGGGGGGLLTNIFHRNKKSTNTTTTTTSSITNAAANKAAAQNRIYGLSSGTAATSSSSSSSTTTNNYNGFSSTTSSANYNWNSAWESVSSSNITTTTNRYASTSTIGIGGSSAVQEAQLISFDSPPSSPTFTQKSNSDCVSVDSFSSDSNFSSPNNGSVSQPESGFEDDFHHSRSRPATTSPLDPWETVDAFGSNGIGTNSENIYGTNIGTAPVRNLTGIKTNASAAAGNLDNPLCNGKSLLPPAQSLTMPTIIKPKIAQKPKAPKPPLLAKPNYVLDLGGVDASVTPPSPPMPKNAPPPPPPISTGTRASGANGVSIIDVISGKVDAMALCAGSSGYVEETVAPYAIALYDFEGVEEDDLSFRMNEKIYLLEQVSETWYRGRTRAGCVGLFPENYVEIKVPLQDLQQQAAVTNNQTTATHVSEALPSARCLYDFPGEFEGDLALKENDIVTVLHRINEDWLYGEIAGRQGQFPAVFLEHVPDQLPMP